MLKKLLKYDLLFLYKGLIIFYALSIFFSILTRIFMNIENSFIINIIGRICLGVTISMVFNILINNLMRMWARFRSNLYGDESYLTHTLPVTKTALYVSKTISAVLSCFISTVVIALSLFIALYSKDFLTTLKNILLPVADILESSLFGIISAFLFILFLEFLNILQCGFTGIILGHRMNGSKIGFSVLFGFIVYIVSQQIALLAVFITALFNKELLNLFITNSAINFGLIKTVILISSLTYLLLAVLGFIINLKLFKKGVNVD